MRIASALVGLTLLLTPACGGGGGGKQQFLLQVAADPVFDGFVTDTAFVDTTTASAISVGDTDAGFANVARGFLRFHLPALPVGSRIVSVILHLEQSSVTGAPFASLGALVVDHVDIGSSLDATDYAATALDADIGTLSTTADLGPRQVDVTSAVLADEDAGRSTSDFRLRFPVGSDADGVDDYVQYDDAEDHFGSGQVPFLSVTYEQ